MKWDTNPCPSPCPSPPDSVPTWHREDLFDQNSEICWIEFPDTILNLFNWIKQKTPFTQTDFWDFYPFVQIAPDKTGQKFNKKSMYTRLQSTLGDHAQIYRRTCYELLRSATMRSFQNNRCYSCVNGTSWVLKSVNLFKLLFQTKITWFGFGMSKLEWHDWMIDLRLIFLISSASLPSVDNDRRRLST